MPLFKNTIYQLLVVMPLKISEYLLVTLNKMVHQLVLITSKFLERFPTLEKLEKLRLQLITESLMLF